MFVAVLAGLLAFPFASLGAANPPKPAGFLAEPKSGHGPGALVLHAWWGLNAGGEALCARLADAGFVAFAPDLFDGKVVAARADAEALAKAYRPKEAEEMAKIADAARYLESRTDHEGIAVVGLSFGGDYALEFANAQPDRVRAVVDFYSTGPDDFHRSKAAYLGHFAEHDEFEPKAGVDATAKALRDAGRPATFHTYPGTGHWFFEPSVKGSYDKEAADLAWKRTLRFLRGTFARKTDCRRTRPRREASFRSPILGTMNYLKSRLARRSSVRNDGGPCVERPNLTLLRIV